MSEYFDDPPWDHADEAAAIVRPITPADLKAVAEIDRDAFETYRRQQRQLTRPLRLRTPENMHAALRRPHAGVVVEAPPGRVVGYCFAHVWGSLGWLGTLGVTPARQGFGLGRRVIEGGLDLLREAGCTTLALETMPESGKNLALYTRLGLEPRYLTLLLRGGLARAPLTHYERWQGGDELAGIAGELVPGLDPTPAARWLDAEQAGDTLIWREGGQPVAFAALRHAMRRAQSPPSFVTVEAAACLPGAAARWPAYLADMQTYAQTRGLAGLLLPVNARQLELVRALLDAGLHVAFTRARMARGPWLGAPDALLMMTLAM